MNQDFARCTVVLGAVATNRDQRWQARIGHQRSFIWRGLQVRYSFWRSPTYSDDADYLAAAPLVLVHGFGASIEHWRDLIPLVAQNRPVYALDLLGFGGSCKAEFPFCVPFWAAQLTYFLQVVVRRPAILMGNSIGSLVCAVTAKEAAAQVAAIALLSVPDVAQRQEMLPKPLLPIVTRIERWSLQPWLLRRLFRFLRRQGVLKKWLKLAYPSVLDISDELLDIIATPTADTGAVEAFIALSRRVSQADFCPPMARVLPDLDCPILILWGEQDRFVPVAIAPTLAQLNPKITLKLLPDLGHCPHDEAPAVVFQMFSEWLGGTNEL
ncbi:MAG: alpha/beta fold hydrolase [Limnothrix sp.]